MCKEGQQLVREHVNAPPDVGSNTTRQQSLSTLSMTVGTETVESARGKKVLKKHLRFSVIDIRDSLECFRPLHTLLGIRTDSLKQSFSIVLECFVAQSARHVLSIS